MSPLADPKEKARAHRIRTTYLLAVLLCLALFYLHTIALFDIAGVIVRQNRALTERLGPHDAGKIIILGCFAVLFVVHILEACCWGAFLRWRRLVASFPEGVYFAAVSMTSVGYGDVVLPPPWRHLGPLGAITGVLTFGCSAAFLFLVMQDLWTQHLW